MGRSTKIRGTRQETTQWGEGRGKGKGTGWVKGLLIRTISEESPISNIKDESDRSKDDPRKIQRDPSNDRSQRRKVLRLPRRSD